MDHRTREELLAGLDHVAASPVDAGLLELIVVRPRPGERLVPPIAEFTLEDGLVGDGWRSRGSRHTTDGSAELDRQVTIANIRAIELVAAARERVPLAGDQLYVDLDISEENLPAGTRLQLGTAVLEVTAAPHTGCAKFADRFGIDAARLANATEGRRWNLRGINARVTWPGTAVVGAVVTKLPRAASVKAR